MQAPKSLTITGTAQAVTLSSSHIGAKWLLLKADAANSDDTTLIGGPEVTSSVGYPAPKGVEIPYRPNPEQYGFYFLDEIYVYLGSGDKLHVLYGG